MAKESFTQEMCPSCGKVTLRVRWLEVETDQGDAPVRLPQGCTNPECESNDPNVSGFDVVKRAIEGR